jgi:hypothetical protein
MRRPAQEKPLPTTSPFSRLHHGLGVSALFVLFFAYVGLRVEPAVQYRHQSPVFLLTASFFEPHLTYPGGLLDYGSAFVSQFNAFNWLGAAIDSILALVALAGSAGLLARVNGSKPRLLPLALAFLVILACEQYQSSSLPMSLGMVIALLATVCYLRWTSSRLRPFTGWACAAGIFYVAGLWPALLFWVLSALLDREQTRPGRYLVMALPLGAIAGLWLLCFRGIDSKLVLNPWRTEGVWRLLALGLYLYVPVSCMGLLVAQRWPRHLHKKASRPGHPATERQGSPTPGFQVAATAAVLVLGWLSVWAAFPVSRKQVAQIDCYAQTGDDSRVLEVAGELRSKDMDAAVEARLHLALWHRGKLAEDIFTYRNQSLWDLMPGLQGGLNSCRAQSRTFYEMGLVSEAEHMAHEALEAEGERPDLLWLLARINVLKGRPKAARVFLKVLGQTLFQRQQANEYRQRLEVDPQLSGDPELADIRSRMLTNDVAHQEFPADTMLLQMLERNSTNQMAFEYLMVNYLLELKIDKLVDRLWQLDSFRYAHIPRHFEEALLLYEQIRHVHVGLRDRTVRPETLERFRRFSQAMTEKKFENPDGARLMAQEFGDTFWYYYLRTRSDRPAQGLQSNAK